MTDPGDLSDPARIAALTEAALAVKDAEPGVAVQMLWRVASRCWWGSAPEAPRRLRSWPPPTRWRSTPTTRDGSRSSPTPTRSAPARNSLARLSRLDPAADSSNT